MLDAYAVKKAIPRVVLAVIAINLSIYLCVAALDITTVVGRGLHSLLVTPFIDQNSFEGIGIDGNVATFGMAGALGAGAIGGAVAIIGSGGAAFVWLLGLLLPLIITITLIALAVLFTLIIRQGLLIFLTVISPLAIVCYILPGTEKYFKQWWDLFLKTLLVYPIIAAIFAMSNVLGAILLTSANGSASMLSGNYFAQATGTDPSATIGTMQVVAAVLVLYLPLVLIPFAFKLAGGAISAVMNAASGRATSLAGRAGQAIQKSRQDQTSWLGSRAHAARGNRRGKGLSVAQVASGAGAALGAARRGESMRTAYGAASRSLAKTKDFDEASQFMENNPYAKEIFGNDDSLFAFRMAMKGKSHESIKAQLMDRGYTGQAAEETIQRVGRARAHISDRAGFIAATRAQAKTGTGFTDAVDMGDEIMQASGGDLNTGARMLAEMRGSAMQAGRVDEGGGSFQTQFDAMLNKDRGFKNVEDEHGNKVRQQYTRENAEADVLKSVAEAVTPGQAMYGKPQSSALIGKGMALRAQEAYKKKYEAKAALDEIQAGVHTGKNTTDQLVEAKSAYNKADREVDQHLASALAMRDAASQSGHQNAREMSDALLNAQVITDPGSGSKSKVFDLASSPDLGKKEGFIQTYRDYSNQYQQDMADKAQRTQQMSQAAAQGNGPPPAPGSGPPPSAV